MRYDDDDDDDDDDLPLPLMCACLDVQTRTTPDTVAQIRSASTSDSMPRPLAGDMTRMHTDLLRSRLRSSIMRSRSLNCHTDSIVVCLSKDLIQVGLIFSY